MKTNKHMKYRRYRKPNSLNALELTDCLQRTARGESLKSVSASYGMHLDSLRRKLKRFTREHVGAELQTMFV